MDHERAFLQAIREAPHDDAPRLIYADWLEEQGGAARTARAAFIRVQCRLATLPEDDPNRDALDDEAADLLAEYEGEWTRPLHGIATNWLFSRGFIERITIGAPKFLTDAERLFEFAPIRALHFLIHPREIPHLAACEHLRVIETLGFSGCHLNDRSLQQLLISPHLQRLSGLHLTGNGINTPGLRALVQSPLFGRLRSLDLSRNIAIGDMAVRLLAQADQGSRLEVLNLARTNLTLDGVLALFASESLPHLIDLNVCGAAIGLSRDLLSHVRLRDCPLAAQLHSLNLSDCPLPAFLPTWFTHLPLRSLRSLSLRNVARASGDAKFLQHVPLESLTRLDLSHNNLGAAGAQALADSPHSASLRHLTISHNNIRDTGAKALAVSPHLKNLRDLNISGNGIGGPGLKILTESPNFEHLRTLCLAGNFIGSNNVQALAESEHLRGLTSLDLSDAFLEEDSARALASSANLVRLRTLLLKKNLLGDAGAKALAQSPHLARLTTLDLNDNRIGKAGAEALAAAAWRRLRNLDVRGNVFTDTQEKLLLKRFGNAVQL
jgi:uncharacterized protein (TIGR02996 family)